MTTPQGWKEIDRIFAAALEREPAERAAFLDRACGGDEELRKEVESLLAHDIRESLLGTQAVDEATRLLEPALPPAAPKAPATGKPGSKEARSSTSHESLDNARFVPGDMLVDRYRIAGLLGRGGMGEVYRADDLKLSQPVALKFLPESLSKDPAALTRFLREVRIARQISHPNVCRVYDIGEAEGHQFISMEYIRGEELASTLKRFGRLPADKALEIARQICAGLAVAHKAGVLHRDLKPANIMIDENGDARITDFGLAALTEEVLGNDAYSGTPAYMSPEQLAGEELTTKSDIYSLGLVLYELFTGKRAFQGANLAELLSQRRSNTIPTSPSSLVKDLDPLVERIIMRCLDKDPAVRPASALQVAAALPGGDPLAAALEAGETPSPEMVAAAPKEGSLRPAVAAACLGALLIGLALIVFFSQRTMLHNYVPLEKSPDVLAERAKEIIKKVGYTDPPADSVYNFDFAIDQVRHFTERDQSPTRWEALRTGDPPALFFWFRQSPRYLVPRGIYIFWSDPPSDYSGMVRLTLDSQGRLHYFEAVPLQLENGQPPATTDWSALFTEAALDMKSFKPAESRWVPPNYSDTRAAWDGVLPGPSQISLHIEAAAYRGRPVYFDMIYPWDQPYRQIGYQQTRTEKTIAAFAFGLVLVIIVGGGVLAWRNVRQGRGDRKGAFRLAVFMFGLNLLRGAIWVHHVPSFDGEFGIFIEHLAVALESAALMWVVYVALEPFLRARWPHRIISWSRMLGGAWRDPLVGRDVLLGAVFGVSLTLLFSLQNLMPRWLGWPPNAPDGTPNGWALIGTRGLLERVLVGFDISLTQALGLLFIFLLLFIILRRDWLAAGAGWGLITFFYSTGGDYASINWSFGMVSAALITFVLMRFGLLALMTLFLVSYFTYSLPITMNLTAWYGTSTIFALVIVAALGTYGFYMSLGGQRLLRGQLLPD
jgi:serine/threonine-protein kinase